ncbi:SRPBCC domain-containing protein [Phenylobacterium sp.]|uniref:SRPBCC domain-containing protein n=1 Tax=Phenylobacterium sp. TaxID=1871053 RepID=UPI0025F9D620|nr:SRPBCC domain-containing protein [Phenylobacterium sp.]
MDLPPARHATLVFERRIAAPVARVYAALSDPAERAAWGAPSDTAVMIYDAADFREGGQDRFRCGPKDNPNIAGVTRYLEIVPGRRVVSSEEIAMDGQRLCASLTTLELWPDGAGARLVSTTQVASFIGEDMIRGHETGHNGAFDSLVRYLSR